MNPPNTEPDEDPQPRTRHTWGTYTSHDGISVRVIRCGCAQHCPAQRQVVFGEVFPDGVPALDEEAPLPVLGALVAGPALLDQTTMGAYRKALFAQASPYRRSARANGVLSACGLLSLLVGVFGVVAWDRGWLAPTLTQFVILGGLAGVGLTFWLSMIDRQHRLDTLVALLARLLNARGASTRQEPTR
ncbi:hypothetical protein JOF53_001280 [Crossiella equi]|uniref:Positive regulator of sigma(E), RseC/MucC n=1 Tax=Crossiella equi TaxID=130796 RepID=A0ABS5A738_9PSEU|nr:hypothetical protein [Crossiella equi]MBP2472408.1 hypothetical protein [Crossiella equi]